MKKTKVFLLTEEELERFDHMLTALGQAYWALVTRRALTVPLVFEGEDKILTPEEQRFYQLHFDLSEDLDKSDF